jgi:hypothetical protein
MGWREDLNWGLAAFGIQIPGRLPSLDSMAAHLAENPCRRAVEVVAATSVLFYMAERGINPRVNSIWDASVYCSTCLSVGYSDILARTPVGKIIGTALMTIGPALAAKTLDGPAVADGDGGVERRILETLEKIHAQLEGRNDRGAEGGTCSQKAVDSGRATSNK